MSLLLLNLLLVIFYTYFGYFILVLVLGKFLARKVRRDEIVPHVTMLIAAYNEEKGIAEKLEDTLKLDYPSEKLRVIVVSDGSTDQTDAIVKSYADKNIELFRVEGRVGKTEARNKALEAIEAEIIIFSDATTKYKIDAIKKLVRNFADPTVGMVTGHLIYQDPHKTQIGMGQILYWKYESMIKKAQTAMGTLTGSVGCVTAFRKKLYRPLPSNIIEDFTEPLMFVIQGFRVVYDEEVICYEETTKKTKSEWHMRIRVIRGGMKGMIYAKKILNPFIYPVPAFQLISHKILRWLIPIFMIAVFFLNCSIIYYEQGSVLFGILLIAQISFYLAAICALLLEKAGLKTGLMALPLYFVVLNAASLIALIKTITSNLEATWETQREG